MIQMVLCLMCPMFWINFFVDKIPLNDANSLFCQFLFMQCITTIRKNPAKNEKA